MYSMFAIVWHFVFVNMCQSLNTIGCDGIIVDMCQVLYNDAVSTICLPYSWL